MDELVGNLVSSLKENGLYDNSVLSSFGLATTVHCQHQAQMHLCVDGKLNFMKVEFEFQVLCIRQTWSKNLGKSTDTRT